MGALLAELSSIEILSIQTSENIRAYITQKNPALSIQERASIFADAVNRIINEKMPGLAYEQIKQIKNAILREAILKPTFSINCSDILKATMKIKAMDDFSINNMGDSRINDMGYSYTGDSFICELNSWLEGTLQKPFGKQRVNELITLTQKLLVESPDMDIGAILETIELEWEVVEQEAAHSKTEIIEEQPQMPVVVSDIEAEPQIPFVVSDIEAEPQIPFVVSDIVSKRKIRSIYILPNRKKAILAAASCIIALTSSILFYSVSNVNALKNAESAATNSAISGITGDDLSQSSSLLTEGSDPSGLKTLKMKATAYDLSYESCGKSPNHPQYGITFSGTRAAAGRTIAVDPKVIPLGCKVKIIFPEKFSHLNGEYIAEDTGRLIKGNSIDVFFGEDEAGSNVINKRAMEFGVQYVEVEIIS